MAINCRSCKHRHRESRDPHCEPCARLATGERAVVYTRWERADAPEGVAHEQA